MNRVNIKDVRFRSAGFPHRRPGYVADLVREACPSQVSLCLRIYNIGPAGQKRKQATLRRSIGQPPWRRSRISRSRSGVLSIERLISRTLQGAGLRSLTTPSLSTKTIWKPRGPQFCPHGRAGLRVGVGQHDNIAFAHHVFAFQQHVDLLLEPRIGRRVGKNDNGAVGPEKIVQVAFICCADIRPLVRCAAVRSQGCNRQKRRENKGKYACHAVSCQGEYKPSSGECDLRNAHGDQKVPGPRPFGLADFIQSGDHDAARRRMRHDPI